MCPESDGCNAEVAKDERRERVAYMRLLPRGTVTVWVLSKLRGALVAQRLKANHCFMTSTLFYQILVSSNQKLFKPDRHAFQWLCWVINMCPSDYGVCWWCKQSPWAEIAQVCRPCHNTWHQHLERSRCHLADNVKELYLSVCHVYRTIIFPGSINQIIVF